MRDSTPACEIRQFLERHETPQEIELIGGPFDGLQLPVAAIYLDAVFPTSLEIVDNLSRIQNWDDGFNAVTSLAHYHLVVSRERLVYQFSRAINPREQLQLADFNLDDLNLNQKDDLMHAVEKNSNSRTRGLTSRDSHNEQSSRSELRWIDNWADLLDTKFEIPGTKVRFGADFILGLLPGIGDAISLGFSGVLVATMARHGASPLLVARMLINVLLDAIVGSVPILGNVFDLFYKANLRNANLLREHYEEGKHRGSVWPLVIGIVATIALAIGGLVWLLVALVSWLT